MIAVPVICLSQATCQTRTRTLVWLGPLEPFYAAADADVGGVDLV